MVEMSSHSLAGFITTLKNVSAAGFKYGKEWSIWLAKYILESLKKTRAWITDKFNAYFIRKDLSKEEL